MIITETLGSIARQTWFHTRLLARNSYFLYTAIGTTFSICAIQALAVRSTHEKLTSGILVNALIVAFWYMSVSSVGILGFQRVQGTLVHLLSGKSNPLRSILPLLLSLLLFSFSAIPCALICALVFQIPINIPHPGLLLFGFIITIIAFISIECVFAALGILTSKALVYESVVIVPFTVLMGIFPIGNMFYPLKILSHLIPGTDAIMIINASLKTPNYPISQVLFHTGLSLLIAVLWFLVATIFTRKASHHALKEGTISLQ